MNLISFVVLLGYFGLVLSQISSLVAGGLNEQFNLFLVAPILVTVNRNDGTIYFGDCRAPDSDYCYIGTVYRNGTWASSNSFPKINSYSIRFDEKTGLIIGPGQNNIFAYDPTNS